MPTYVYGCKKCKIEFELVLPMANNHDPDGENCEVCGAKSSIRLLPSWGGAVGDSVALGIKQPDNGFKDVLAKISENHPLGNYGRYGPSKVDKLAQFEEKMGKKYRIGGGGSSLNMRKVKKKRR